MKLKGRWKKSKFAPVYEREDGLRIHTHGLIRLPCGLIEKPCCALIEKAEKIVGGRRSRAMMAIANGQV